MLVTSTSNLPKPGPMSMILYWDHRVSRLAFLSLQASFNGTIFERCSRWYCLLTGATVMHLSRRAYHSSSYIHRLKDLSTVFVASGVYGIASAGIALFITLYRTGRQVQQASSLRLATPLSEVLLRDGTFVNLTDQNAAHVSTSSGSLFFLSVSILQLGQCAGITFLKYSLILLVDVIGSVPATNVGVHSDFR